MSSVAASRPPACRHASASGSGGASSGASWPTRTPLCSRVDFLLLVQLPRNSGRACSCGFVCVCVEKVFAWILQLPRPGSFFPAAVKWDVATQNTIVHGLCSCVGASTTPEQIPGERLERASKKPTKKGLSSQPKRCWREFTSQKSSAPTASLHCQIAKAPHRQIFLAPNLDARNRRRPNCQRQHESSKTMQLRRVV